MSLLNFGKKKENKKCCCGCSCACSGVEITGTVHNIKILGAGCASCHQQYKNVQAAVNNLGLSAEVEYITDMSKIIEYGVMSLPAIIINEKVAAMGKVLKTADVEKLLQKTEV